MRVLEDLTNYRIVDDIEGCSPEDAATAVQNLAAFHAIWWSNPALERMDWLKPFDRSFSLELLGKPAATFAGPLPKVIREIAQRVQVHYGHLFEMQSRPPLTIVLNDVKARHMFFGTNSQADEFAIDSSKFRFETGSCPKGKGLWPVCKRPESPFPVVVLSV